VGNIHKTCTEDDMSGQDWSIKITPAATGTLAVFTPDLLGANPGDPLPAGNADIISWNNRTADAHWPWALGPDGEPLSEEEAKAQGLYLSDETPAWESSSPGYVTLAPSTGSTTINYICKLHPQETGSIVVSA
jgi:hypothetical protein